MSGKFLPIGLDESQRQLFARSLRPRLEAELQQQIIIYAQQFGDVSVCHARHIIREHADAFLQSLQSLPGSSSLSRPHAAQNMASRAETGASRCRLYLLRPGQPLSYTTTSIFLGNLQSNLRSSPAAIFQQALSSPDLVQLLQRQHGTPSTYLPLRHVAVCPIVDRIRKLGHAIRVGGAFKKMIRVAMKTLGHLFKDPSFGKQLERPIARFILGLILERECASFGPTPFFVDRTRLYTVRLQGLTRYLDKISRSAQDMAEIIDKLRMPTAPDMNRLGALIRQGNMSIGTYVARSASPVASPHTIAASVSVTQIAEPKLATPKQTSATFESRSDTVTNSQTSVPVASSMNVLQHTTPVLPAHIVPNTHAVSLSVQVQPITTHVTQLVGATTYNVNTNGPLTIHGAFPQSDAMEDCIPEPTRCQQVGTTDSRVGLFQAMDGVETSSASNHVTNIGNDEMDDVQHTNQPTVVAPASSLVQNENQNVPDAPPLTIALESTIKSTGALSSITVGETKDRDMPDVLPTARPMLSIAIEPNLAPHVTTTVVTKDQDMTDTPLPEHSTVRSGRHISEAPTITTISSVNRIERSTSTLPVAPLTFPSSARHPSATLSFSSLAGAESTIQSRAKLRAQANTHNHWANGKAQALLEQVSELHRALQQALSKTGGPGPRDHFRNEVLGYIDNAKSATELAHKIDYAMRHQLLTNAEFNKLARHAHDGQHARRRETQGKIAIQNTCNTPQTSKQVVLSQAADKDNAQPAAPVTPLASSQAASNVIAQLTNLAAPSQTANTGATILSGPLMRRESATSGPQLGREELTRLLIEAQRKMMNKTDKAWSLFSSMFDYSWQKPSDNEIVINYVIKHPRFQGSDSGNRKRVNIEWTIDVIRGLVADPAPSSCEILIWSCNEALNAQDVKADEEIPGSYATCADRQKELEPLFRRISATNFGLMKQVFPSGCVTWDEMKNLAKTEELSFFRDKKPGRYVPYMRNLKEYWRVEDNMKKFIVDRNEAQSMATSQETTSGLTGSPKAKRNIAEISSDHDKVSKQKDADAIDDDDGPNVPEANDAASKRFCNALTEKEERAAMKEKKGRRADDSGGSDRMKRNRE
ncbi:unnamed protein product [Alternaria alternata]